MKLLRSIYMMLLKIGYLKMVYASFHSIVLLSHLWHIYPMSWNNFFVKKSNSYYSKRKNVHPWYCLAVLFLKCLWYTKRLHIEGSFTILFSQIIDYQNVKILINILIGLKCYNALPNTVKGYTVSINSYKSKIRHTIGIYLLYIGSSIDASQK